jgi:MFS family permease
MFISNKGGYLTTRFLLGLMESGYIPGGLYVLSMWYTKQELALRTAIYFLGNMAAQATTGLIAYGILRLAGQNGLA